MNTWAKVAHKEDVELSNSFVVKKQKEEKEERDNWIRPREEILLPYLEYKKYLSYVILQMVFSMEQCTNPLGWTQQNLVIKGIRVGTKVVCTKSFIGHVGYVQLLSNSKISFRIISLSQSYEIPVHEAQNRWGLAVLPDDIDISKQMTATEAYKYIASLDKKLNIENKVDELDAADTLPIISQLNWGVVKVRHKGDTLFFKDAKLYPGGATAWDWSKTGTHRNPGIQYADVHEILRANVEVIILTKGQNFGLEVSDELVTRIEEEGVTVHVSETREGVRIYELYREVGVRVGILIHSTG